MSRIDSYKDPDFKGGVDHFSIDCMELLQLPHFGGSSQPAESFYLRKMSVTPAGIYDEVEQTGVTYVYSQLLGKTNANHIASLLDDTVRKKKEKVDNRKLRANFDNCSVNKCYLLIRYGVELIRLKKYDIVDFSFMVAGHTKFSPDRMFGWKSGILSSSDLFEVSDVKTVVDVARLRYSQEHKKNCPYSVELVDSLDANDLSTFFSDWKEYFSGSYSQFGFISSLHRLKLGQSVSNPVLKGKEKSSDPEWKVIKFFNSSTEASKVNKEGPKRIPRVPLKKAKMDDLKKLTKYIPAGTLSYVDGPP